VMTMYTDDDYVRWFWNLLLLVGYP